MKCDELKYENLGDMMPFYPRSTLVIRKQFVDAAIDELKREHHRERDEYIDWVNKLQRENSELKAMVTTDNSAVIARLEDSLRKTQRALYKACRNWFRNQACAMRQFNLEARAKKFDKAEERAKEMSENKELKPRHEDKTLQERLNEVCKKYGVSTLQDLDLALCKAYESNTNFCIDAHKLIIRQKRKRCLALAKWCQALTAYFQMHENYKRRDRFRKWMFRFYNLADKFKEA